MTRNRYCAFALFLLTLQSLFAATLNKDEAKALVLQGRYAEALPHLERLVAQNRRSGAQWYLAIARQHLYDFEGAIESIETYREVLHSEEWIDRADSLLELCQLGQRAFEHTLDVEVIDSILVPKETFFEHYKLGSESGHIVRSEQGLYYENPAEDYRIYSDGNHLFEQHKFQEVWEERHQLEGIGTEDFTMEYPFLRSDGQTLYFACDSLPGLGGYDIYRTTYDADEGAYYQPERLGMPFNSAANDYMMAIDETHQVGWWASDRNAPEGHVTLYLFLLKDEYDYLDEPTVSRARLDCIRETWKEPEGYASLIEELMNATPEAESASLLHINIADGVVYTSEDQFHSSKAWEAYRQSEQLAQQISALEQDVADWRKALAGTTEATRASLSQRILTAEQDLFTLTDRLRQAVLEYRKLEQEEL